MPPKIKRYRPAEPAADPTGELYLSAKQVCDRYGGITKMSLWRWLRDPDMQFPAPILIQGRRYFRLGDLRRWEIKRAAAA